MLRRSRNDGSILEFVLLSVDESDVSLLVSDRRRSRSNSILIRVELRRMSQ